MKFLHLLESIDCATANFSTLSFFLEFFVLLGDLADYLAGDSEAAVLGDRFRYSFGTEAGDCIRGAIGLLFVAPTAIFGPHGLQQLLQQHGLKLLCRVR